MTGRPLHALRQTDAGVDRAVKLWIVDACGSYETVLVVVRAESLERAQEMVRNRLTPEFTSRGNRELLPTGPEAIVWIYERSWDPRSG